VEPNLDNVQVLGQGVGDSRGRLGRVLNMRPSKVTSGRDSASCVTPHVTNHLGILDHVAVNPNDRKEIEFSNEEIEIQTSVVIDPDASVQIF
jgi:hypothetical protein